jgi:hypothetical protein
MGTTVKRSTESAFRNHALDIMANYRYGIGFLQREGQRTRPRRRLIRDQLSSS